MADFDGKVIVVTGSATGLGAAIALGAAKRGAKAVILNYTKSAKEADATAREVRAAGAEAEIVRGDVASDADCRTIAAAAARFGRIDALVNNAGITKHVAHGDMDGLSAGDFQKLFAVNAIGPFQMVRACRALLEARRAVERADDLVDRGRHRYRLVDRLCRLQGRAQHDDAVARARAGPEDPRQRHLPWLHRHALVQRFQPGARAENSRAHHQDDATAGGLAGRGHRRCQRCSSSRMRRATSPARR